MYLERDKWIEYTANSQVLINNVSNEKIYFKTSLSQDIPCELLPNDMLKINAGQVIYLMSKTNCNIAICEIV